MNGRPAGAAEQEVVSGAGKTNKRKEGRKEGGKEGGRREEREEKEEKELKRR